MLLNSLDKIIINNQLKGVISEIVVQYAESNKSLNNWYNIRGVNVETLENIAWSRCATFDKDITSGAEVEINANNICFGENNGFWQVYFVHENKRYKLFKPNCGFDLNPEDNNETLRISFLLDLTQEEDSIIAEFQKKSTSKCFPIVEGNILTRGVNISLTNNALGAIDDISVVLIETFSMSSPKISSNDDKNSNFNTTNYVKFDGYKLDKEGTTVSKEPTSFTCHKHSQYWQVKFSYANYLYELQTTRSASGISFNLDSKHHGSDLAISIFEVSETSEIGVRFEIDGSNKTFSAKKLKLVSERIDEIKKMSNEFNCPKLSRKFSLAVHNFTHALRTLSRVGYKNFSKEKMFSSDVAHLFYPSLKPDIHSVEFILEKSKISVGTFLLKMENEDGEIVINAIKNIHDHYKHLKEVWQEILAIVKRLKSFVKDFENRKCGEDNEDNLFLKSVFHNLDLFNSMQINFIVCELLDLMAFNEIGLSFKISHSERMHEVSVELGNLALVLEDELKMWNQKVMTSDNDLSKEENVVLESEPTDGQVKVDDNTNDLEAASPIKCNGATNVEDKLTTFQLQILCESSLVKSAELFQMVRHQLTDCLLDISSAIHLTNRNVNISMITSSAVGLFGAGLVITGLVLTPFTAGISSGLVVAGVGVGASGGALGVGTSIADSVLTQNYLKSTLDLALVDRKVCRSVACLQAIIAQNKLLANLNGGGGACASGGSSTTLHHPQYETKVVNECAANAISNFSVVAVKTGVQVAKNTALRLGSVTVGVLFDVTSLAVRAVNLSRGGKSELGYKMEVEAQDLLKELEDVLDVVEQMGVRVGRRDRDRSGSDSSNESMPITRPVLEWI